MSTEMLNTLHNDLVIDTEVIPGDAPWRLSTSGVIMKLVKRTAPRLIRDVRPLVKNASCKR